MKDRRLVIEVPEVRRDVNSDGVVVIVNGYRDAGFEKVVGCPFAEMAWTRDWVRLFASRGLRAVTVPAGDDPAASLRTFVAEQENVGLFAVSGHAPNALAAASDPHVRCAALLYPYTTDAGNAAKAFGFANPALAELREDLPLFVGRAGRDEMPRLNETLDAFVQSAMTNDFTLMNHREAPHAFDLVHDSARTREIIEGVLAFFVARLTPARAEGAPRTN